MSPSRNLLRTAIRLSRLVTRITRQNSRMRRTSGPAGAGGSPGRGAGGSPGQDTRGGGQRDYDGDFTGTPQIEYSPVPDGLPDPGEVVWTWVPYEEDHTQGKDRPVLIIGRDDEAILALQMTSKDHDAEPGQDDRWGRQWVDMGSGAWDSKGRESMARTDRILRLDPADVRRVGAILDRDRFEAVAAAVAEQSD